MHNLAVALHQKGYKVTGSDDEIYEPAVSRLQNFGLMPDSEGWFPEKISSDLDAVILGMHARKDNPEMAKAKELGLKIYSYPEFIYQQSLNKERVVIGGSHGKTTTTAMIMHVLKACNRDFDYLIGATLEGFDSTVRLTHEAPVIVIEGDEYPTSPLDPTPKFLHYHHHVGLVTGIAWDHINVYPEFDHYVKQFEEFVTQTPKAGSLVFCEEDNLAALVCRSNKLREDVNSVEYHTHSHKIRNGITYLQTAKGEVQVPFFGKHNMQNVSGAKAVCSRLAVSETEFYEAIKTFKGANKRLERIGNTENMTVFRDFAHAPSKVQATINAAKDQFLDRNLIACAELHTFSSLNKSFLPHYKDTMNKADIAVVYYNPKTVEHKRLQPIAETDIRAGFNRTDLQIFTDSGELRAFLEKQTWQKKNLLLMSSGTFDNMNLGELVEKILQ